MTEDERRWRDGGCRCGAIRFRVCLSDVVEARPCTCSICTMTGFEHVIVESEAFRLVDGERNLAYYAFNTGVASHLFCKTCGVKSFYRPRSHPEGWSVNARCIDLDETLTLTLTPGTPFDGRNWEAQFTPLAHDVREVR